MRVLVLALLATALAGCTSELPRVEPTGPEVELHALTFEPGDIQVQLGDTVTFRVIEASHTIDFAEGDADVDGVSMAHSGNVDPGDVVTVTFNEPGTYPFFCAYHSSISGGERIGMVGTITVV